MQPELRLAEVSLISLKESCLCSRRLILLLACLFLFVLSLDSPIWENWESGDSQVLRNPQTLIDMKLNISRETKQELGSFPYRNFINVQESCSKIHSLSKDKKLECDGIKGVLENSIETCGGIPLQNNMCIMAETSSFKYDDDDVFTKKKICHKDVKLVEGYFSNFKYHGPDNCELQDLNSKWLHDKFEGNLIVFIGDSHVRNLFTSFIAEVRNQKYVVERHPDIQTKETMYPYQMYSLFPKKDHLKDLKGSHYLTRQAVISCKDQNGCCPVQVLFLWAGFPSEYEALLKGALLDLSPDLIITNLISKSYTTQTGFENGMNQVKSYWETYFKKSRIPKKFVVTPFPLYGGDEVVRVSELWLASEQLKSFSHLIVQSDLIKSFERTGGKLSQLKATSHTVCSLYDNFSLDSKVSVDGGHKIAGHEECVAPIDRAVVRLAFTVAMASP